MRCMCSSLTVTASTLNATMVSVCFPSHRLSSRLINISDQSLGVPSLLLTHITQHNKTTHGHEGQKRKDPRCTASKSAMHNRDAKNVATEKDFQTLCEHGV